MDSSQYKPPARRSLSDEELDARVKLATSTHTGVEALMELLVAQEALRAQEDAEIAAWVERMEAEGSPESIAALAKFHGEEFVPATDQFPVVEQVVPEAPVFQNPLVVEEPVVEEPVAEKPFSWFTEPDPEDVPQATESQETPEIIESLEQIEEVVVVEEVVVEDVAVVDTVHEEGTETSEEFENLIRGAAPEEELTALEEKPKPVQQAKPKNVAVPSEATRTRKPISQLIVWVGASSTVVPMVLAWALLGFGLSGTAMLFDLAIGYLIAGALVSMAALAGKRSGLATPVISRAIFGVWGNSIPLAVNVISRTLLTAMMIGSFLILTNGTDSRLPAFETIVYSFPGFQLTAGFTVGVGFLALVTVFALLRGQTNRIAQLGLSLVALVLVLESFAGIPVANLALVNVGSAGIVSKQSIAAICLVVSVVCLLWISIAPNLSKSVPMKHRGIKVYLSLLGAHFAIPAMVSALAAIWFSAVAATKGVGALPQILAASLPSWSTGALTSGIAIAFIYITTLSLRSLGLEVMSLTKIKSKAGAVVIGSALVLLALVLFAQQPQKQMVEYFANLGMLVLALSAGWMGMFVADVALRRIAYHELSLTRSYGYYGKFNLLSLSLWLVTVVAAVLIVPINLLGFNFMGMFASSLGLAGDIGSQAIACTAIMLLGIVLTVAARIPQIRKQEREVLEVESRRDQLNDIFVGQE